VNSAPYVTLQQVARAARVDVSTASLALARSPKLAAATGERLRRLAAEMGYRRNPVFQALARRRAATPASPPPLIAFLTNRPSLEEFHRVSHMPGFLAGAKEQAAHLGFGCELVLTGGIGPRSARGWLNRPELQGVILAAFMPHWPAAPIELPAVAVAKIDSHYLYPAAPRISYDLNQIVGTTCQRLHGLGYRRIGLAVGEFDEDGSDQLYRSAFLLHQHLLGVRPTPPLYFAPRESVRASASRLRAWVRRNQLDAVISNWGNIRDLLRRAGWSVPGGIACASLCLPQPDAALAGMVMNHLAVGRKAVEAVALLVGSPRREPGEGSTTLIRGTWHDGASAPAIPAHPATSD
jgi:LacI family transcriptional regulator